MTVHVWARPVACPHSQQNAWPQRHSTRLQLRGGREGASAAQRPGMGCMPALCKVLTWQT